MYPKLQMFVGGSWQPSGAAGYRPVINPADDTILGQLPLAGEEDLRRAASAADSGFATWSAMPAFDRFTIMRRAAALMRERAEAASLAMTLEQGKPLAESKREILLSADIIDFLAEEGKRIYGRTVPPRAANILLQHVGRIPIGPVLALTPWNFPANLPSRKIGGALAAGCSCIIKPAETTPASCQLIVEAFADAGLPPGVLNLVYGEPDFVARRLIASPVIKKISFTGSIQIGKRLAALAAEGVKRITLELGGHAPVIIADDADLDAAISACVAAKFRNAGQVCISPTRFLVQRGIYQAFLEGFVERTKQLVVGPGLGRVDLGPLAHAGRLQAMQSLAAAVQREGGEIATGGTRQGDVGCFFQPTVVSNPPLASRLMTEEPFGPMASIVPFDTLAEALAVANSLNFALAAYAFTGSLERAHDLGHGLRAGMVGINHFAVSQPETPFGGLDESGYGSESGLEGVLGYTDTKFLSVARQQAR
jgi:succinate-semialdehyde dehydrogenase/glutarate-semialdehyde dehydrogenase